MLLDLGSDASKDEGLETPHGQVDGAASAENLDTALLVVDLQHLALNARAGHLENDIMALQ